MIYYNNKMRDPERIDVILNKIREKWHKHPDYRLGQLLINDFGYPTTDIFNIEDSLITTDVFKDLEYSTDVLDYDLSEFDDF